MTAAYHRLNDRWSNAMNQSAQPSASRLPRLQQFAQWAGTWLDAPLPTAAQAFIAVPSR